MADHSWSINQTGSISGMQSAVTALASTPAGSAQLTDAKTIINNEIGRLATNGCRVIASGRDTAQVRKVTITVMPVTLAI